jgi:hypothetical protein
VSAVALAARIVLAVTLAVAALLKLAAHERVRAQMVVLVGDRAGPFAAWFVPVTELVLAFALVLAPASPIPGVGAAAVLVVFTFVLVRAQVRSVPCPCFGGGAATAPVGPSSVVRNGVLLALAVLATGNAEDASLTVTLLWIAGFGFVTAIAVRASR